MNQKQKNRAKQIFEGSEFELLYMNKKGHFFTSKNLAVNSVETSEDIVKVTRDKILSDGAKNKQQQKVKKLIVEAADNSKIVFIDLKEGDTPKEGDKAKIGSKDADGVIKIDPQTSYKFDKGALVEIIKEQ